MNTACFVIYPHAEIIWLRYAHVLKILQLYRKGRRFQEFQKLQTLSHGL